MKPEDYVGAGRVVLVGSSHFARALPCPECRKPVVIEEPGALSLCRNCAEVVSFTAREVRKAFKHEIARLSHEELKQMFLIQRSVIANARANYETT